MEIKSKLMNIGLAKNQALIYLNLLENEILLAGEITKNTGINRTNVYDSLDKLIEKGLVGFVIKQGKKYFQAKSEKFLFDLLEQKEKEIQEKRKMLNSILPEIKRLKKLNFEGSQAIVYRGRKGLKFIAEDVINCKKEIFVFGAQGNFQDFFKDYFEQWHLKRKLNKIKLKIVFNEKVKSKRKGFHPAFSEVKFSDSLEETPATTWIYSNKIAIIVWSDSPTIILIESNEVSKSYKQFFNALWEQSKK